MTFIATTTRGTIFSSSLALLMLSLINTQAFAADCKGTICIGGLVIDGSNYVGQVTGFLDANTAQYRVGSSTLNSALSNLKAETPDFNGISVPKKVVDASNYVGQTIHVFEDGRTQYQVGSSLLVSKSVSPEIEQLKGIRKGTAVVDSSNYVGTALTVFANQKVQYQVGSSMLVSASVVGEVTTLNGIKAGAQVVDSSNYVGVALYVFADGRVQYLVGSSQLVSSRVSGQVDSYAGISTGTIVVDASNYVGKTNFAFQDGRISYQVGSSSLVSNKVSPQVEDLNGIKTGVFVVDSSDYVGTVKYAFRDGRVNYQVGSSSLVSARVSKEVELHSTYQKGVIYATPSYSVGKAIRFFENGKVQLELLSDGTTVGMDLYSAIDQIDGYKAEVIIVDSRARDGVIKMVFANGAVAYALRNPTNDDEKVKLFGGKVYSFFLPQDQTDLATLQKNELKNWIIEIARTVAKKENLPEWGLPWGQSYRSVAMPENMPQIKKALLERLFDEPELINNRDLRKKVRDYLSQ